MKSNKFKRGDKVIYAGKECKILSLQKDFLTKKIRYSLDINPLALIAEESLSRSDDKINSGTKTKSKKMNDELNKAHEEYRHLLGESVPKTHKKDLEWINSQIEEVKSAQNAGKDDDNEVAFDLLVSLNHEELVEFIRDKGLEIDPADYEADDLLTAVCEELNVDMNQK